MQKKYYAHFEDINYYPKARENIKEYFGKEFVTPYFKRKRDLVKYLDELDTEGMLSHEYTEYVVVKGKCRSMLPSW